MMSDGLHVPEQDRTLASSLQSSPSQLPVDYGSGVISKLISSAAKPAQDLPAAPPSPLTLADAIDTVFFDHSRVETTEWDDIAEMTFHGRNDAMFELRRELRKSIHTNRNILLVGDPGFGKSTLIRKVIRDLTVKDQPDYQLFCGYLALRQLGGGASNCL